MMLGAGGASKTYIDDVFSTYLYRGTGSTRSIVNGIDLSGEGGATWIKNRDQNDNNWLFATSLGAGTGMRTNSTGEAWGFGNPGMTSFNSNGFTVGTHDAVNGTDENLVSWSWRKAAGFFDTIAYEGTGSTQQISHSLGCKPGMIILKNRDMVNDWAVWHKGVVASDATNTVALNSNAALSTNNTYFDSGSTPPTATNFTVHSSNRVNENDDSYVAYVFAGGEEQGNASVDIDGQNGHYMEWEASSDWVFDGQFCIEYWVYMDANSGEEQVLSWGTGAYRAIFWTGSTWKIEWPTGNSNFDLGGSAPTGAWKHHVLTRDGSNVVRFFIDGVMQSNQSTSDDIGENSKLVIGIKYNYPSGGLQGKVSNVRIVKGSIPTTYQTSSTSNSSSIFTSPTSPLTTTSQGATESHVKLLCCNDIGASAFTVSPGAIILKGSPHGNATSSPFAASTATDAGAVFGEDEDKSIMKCGIYLGNGATTGNEVDLGFEPQYVMIKRINTTGEWYIYDDMRQITSWGLNPTEAELRADSSASEYDYNRLDLTSRGFRPMYDQAFTNNDGSTYLYFCVRRKDGYVRKPVTTGTDVFSMVNGASSTTLPIFTTNIPIDYYFYQRPENAAGNWMTGARLTGATSMKMNLTDQFQDDSNATFDFSNGFGKWTGDLSAFQLWSFARHAGFDVVVFKGNGEDGHKIMHSLGKTPEMIWIKNLNRTSDWIVGHKGLNGGTNPWNYQFTISTRGADAAVSVWNNTAPTSTYFTLDDTAAANYDGEVVEAILFASTDVSFVGSYTADGNNTVNVTTGFQPRFLWAKNISESATNDSNAVFVFDTLRGWGSGNDEMMDMSSTNVQNDTVDYGAPTSTGFTLVGGTNMTNQTDQYVFYAHA